jgi:uncharacterized OB-fold protein
MEQPVERVIPAPVPTEDSKVFWDAAKEERFLVKRCMDCGQAHWYPRALCPFCLSANTQWHPATGRGTIYSYSVMRKAPQPYAVAFVTLAEGPTMLTNLVDCDFDRLAIGQPVSVVFKQTDGEFKIPVFTPAAPRLER